MKWLTLVLLTLSVVAMVMISVYSDRRDAHLVEVGVHIEATYVADERDPDSVKTSGRSRRTRRRTVRYYVEYTFNGREYMRSLVGADVQKSPVDPEPAPGDVVNIVIDPEEPRVPYAKSYLFPI